MATNPVADLTYRGYDGPMEPPSHRWRVIARTGILAAFRKKSYWVLTAFAGWYYLVLIVIMFFIEQVALSSGSDRAAKEFFDRIIWKDQFLHGFSFASLIWLILALILGAGAIANDNRGNALLVYLSKPCTKRDYLFGKWMGIFVPLLIAMIIPTAFFYAYGAMNFRDRGFLSDDPWLLLRIGFFLPVAAAFHASLVTGISSMFSQGRLAGATYAGLFFISNFFTQLMVVAANSRGMGGPMQSFADKAYYFSIDGLLIGLCKVFLDSDGSPYFGIPSRIPSVPKPPALLMFVAILLVGVGLMAVAWKRIRAVEVVK